MPHNERGEIFTDTNSERENPSPTIYNTSIQSNRSIFLITTLIMSPIIYSIVGMAFNYLTNLGLDTWIALFLGGGIACFSTFIFNMTVGKGYTGKIEEYIFSLGIPAIVLIVITFGIIILLLAFCIFVIIGLISGGG